MRVTRKRYSRMKQFGKLSYSDDLDRDPLYHYTNYWNVTKFTYLNHGKYYEIWAPKSVVCKSLRYSPLFLALHSVTFPE